MELEKELEIVRRQPLYGCTGTYIGNFFQALIVECNKHIGGAAGNPHFLMSQAFNYGLIQGKRSERARWRGEAFDIDPPVKKSEEIIREMLALLIELDIEEIEYIHSEWRAIAADRNSDQAGLHFIDRMVDLVIKEKAGAADE